MNLIIFGPPGAGKGTYASRLTQELQIANVSTGNIFRDEIKFETPLGKKAAKYLKSGVLVPDEIVNRIIRDRLSRAYNSKGFILDGYPRTLEQAKALTNIARIDAIINLIVPEWIIIERLSNRRICGSCGAIYNLKYHPKPKVDLICDKCSGEVYQREDDKPEVIKDRLRIYNEQTMPIIEYYKNRVSFVNIENRQVDAPREVILKRIINELHKINLVR